MADVRVILHIELHESATSTGPSVPWRVCGPATADSTNLGDGCVRLGGRAALALPVHCPGRWGFHSLIETWEKTVG